MPLQVFVDESGKGDGPVFVLAGFIARTEQWAAFNTKWRSVLADYPEVESFHMTEARYSGHANLLLPRLIPIIQEHVLSGLAITLFHNEFDSEIRGKIDRKMDQPYTFLYHAFIGLAAQWQINEGLSEKAEFIFDEQKNESDYLDSIWDYTMEGFPSEFVDLTGSRPVHLNDKDHPPLQAADLLAWSVRRYIAENPSKFPNLNSRQMLPGVPLMHWHQTGESMATLVKTIGHRNRERGYVTRSQYEKALPHRDKLITGLNVSRILAAPEGTTIPMNSFPATQTKRFLLVHKCPHVDIPHLHRRAGNECLGGS